MKHEAVYLDRDGVINVELFDYVIRPEELALIPGSAEAIRRLNEAGLPVAVVTNQSGVAKGRQSADQLAAVHGQLVTELAKVGARVDGVWHCPHRAEDDCACRKPRPGMLLEAAAALGFAPDRAVLVGDTPRDLEAARAVGAATVLVRTGKGARTEAEGPVLWDHVCADLAAAVEWILGR